MEYSIRRERPMCIQIAKVGGLCYLGCRYKRKECAGSLRWLDRLPLKDESKYLKVQFNIHTHYKTDCLSYVTQRLPRNSDLHIRASCHGNYYNLVCPCYKSKTEGGDTFQVHGVKLWNGIPLDVHKRTLMALLSLLFKKCFL